MNEFRLFSKTKYLLKYTEENILVNIPKVHNTYRVGIVDNIIKLNENIIRSNINEGSIRNKYQKEMLVNISMLDLYFSILLDLNMVNKKKFMILIRLLNEIKKMSMGWINNEKIK